MTDAARAADAPYIVCEDLFKIYKLANLEVVALRGLDLKVRPREFMAIVGASGSGKSSAAALAAAQSSSEMLVLRFDLADYEPER